MGGISPSPPRLRVLKNVQARQGLRITDQLVGNLKFWEKKEYKGIGCYLNMISTDRQSGILKVIRHIKGIAIYERCTTFYCDHVKGMKISYGIGGYRGF